MKSDEDAANEAIDALEASARSDRTIVHKPMPVRGYQPQSDENVQLVNEGKAIEAALIAYLDKLMIQPATDKRMVALGRTNVQQGCMWAYRAVFQPSES